MASSSLGVGFWRTSFLSLRDEALTCPSPPRLSKLLQDLVFSHSHSLLSAASDIPIHELTADLLFLLELVAKVAVVYEQERALICSQTCELIHDVCLRVSFPINASSWTLLLDSFAGIVDFLLQPRPTEPMMTVISYTSRIKPVSQCLETLRRLTSLSRRKLSLSENIHLVKFLLHVIASLHADLMLLYRSLSANQRTYAEKGKRSPKLGSFWDVLALAFDFLSDSFAVSDSLFPLEICQSTVEAFRKVMDVLASKSHLVEDNAMLRFYSSLLHCLHLVLIEPKCPVSDHVSSFVAVLRMFFNYGRLAGMPQLSCPDGFQKDKQFSTVTSKLATEDQKNVGRTPYRPPHLRKDSLNGKQPKAWRSSDHESDTADFPSSDSDYSDSDGPFRDTYSVKSSKVRVAAIVCLQDLCKADTKSFTTQWISLLPTSDVLNPRKSEATLLTCLLSDPHLKVRIACASALSTMMESHSSVFLQVAEYKESSKYGSFMPLSSSLGLILMQLHTGILYLIQRETHGALLTSLFKNLVLLISCTPYSRLPGELLSSVITSLHTRITQGFPFKNDQTGLLVASISCMAAAFSASPPQTHIRNMLAEEISAGIFEDERNSGILSTLFQYAEKLTHTPTCFEALQALRTVAHNYPTLVSGYWEQVSDMVYKVLKSATLDVSPKTWKAPVRDSVGFVGEKVIVAATKVLDESLRAVSGFKGTEDLLDGKLLDTPFTSECIRSKKVSSAPSYGHDDPDYKEEPHYQLGSDRWSQAIKKHIPLVLQHESAMVRVASVTCFAGITSTAFYSLKKEEKNFIISAVISAALKDEAPSVRSAASRAIGVISCFPEISQSVEILNKFILAIEANTRDPLILVRITASWALANICDSLRHLLNEYPLEQSNVAGSKTTNPVDLLVECALHLTKDGDKVKSNAVRALGSLSRSIRFSSSSDSTLMKQMSSLTIDDTKKPCASRVRHSSLLERIVQAFLSCVTTGNVKVQWNVCHALSNLFANETIVLQDMDWSPSVFSILLLLLRDSSNFKIRIQAAAALAVPPSALDYGKSFSDVVQGVEHILENLSSDQGSAPSNFKYRMALEKQLTSTMLHLLSLVSAESSSHHPPLTDFLLKKASFLEEWLKTLCSSLAETSTQPESSSVGSQKKEMISKAVQSLTTVLSAKNHTTARKFQELTNSL